MTNDEIQKLLRELRDEPVPADSLARVRQGVEERTRARRSWWKAAILVPLPVTSLVLLMLLRREPEPEPAPIPAPMTQAPSRPLVAPKSRHAVSSANRPATRNVRQPRPLSQPPAPIRIETEDPEVVIMLLAE